jgi:hypothetical protein
MYSNVFNMKIVNLDKYFFKVLYILHTHVCVLQDRFWRKTRSPNNGSDCIGTDPNRNWGFHWNGINHTYYRQ